MTNQTDTKLLILYCSLTGNTQRAAKTIQELTDGDLIRIRQHEPFPEAYEDYMRVAKRQFELQLLPIVDTAVPNLKEYDTIMIGYPTWWSQPPMVIHSLFEKFDFTGKKIIPFSTSSTSPYEDTEPIIKKLVEENHAEFIPGFRYDNDDVDLEKRLSEYGLL
ncbi:flavodoxin [Lentilactobacillus sp. Marseille-Q4993]|uniref:flavodoxin n=1 Tax=Lentilactobacillus sp. Marseille-Q4993 TaxID=3039492 RepID=UPI0024BC56E9|nr:flavodoxin [Lentilactobacillus sp. Marseille-Q4993]